MSAVYASTSPEWFNHLRGLSQLPAEVAFWRPTDSEARKIRVGEPWFFKQWGAPVVLGYGRFLAHQSTTIDEIWTNFGTSAGSLSRSALIQSIASARGEKRTDANSEIGNVVLSHFTPFDRPYSLTLFALPNLTAAFRYVPEGNRLLSYANEIPLEQIYNAVSTPKRRELTTEIFARNTGHVQYVKSLYEGKCQVSGNPVLDGAAGNLTQVHHIEFLCEGGSDDPSNMVALSPDWHAVAHAAGTQFDWQTLEFIVGERRHALKLNRHLKPR